jgi:anion-transporting  ArsA/GET3 family ATPase
MTPESLDQIVMSRHVIIAVGAGGVGKTTTAAALGVAAALRGRRVLCLTIDPARRLAQALGLERMSSEEQVVAAERFAREGVRVTGSLSAMMLDTKRTFDELIAKYATSPERAQRLLNNKLYKYISMSLAGTQEYMAMEKLVAVQQDPRFDLVVLDTPPTANALDFLDAPERLVEALDSTTMRWMVQAFQSTGKVGFNLLARSAGVVLRAIARITGAGFLEAMSEFLAELNDMFGGFKLRALAVEKALRSPDVTFVLVTSPTPPSIEEVLFFSDRLVQASMPRGAFVVNRFRAPPPFAGAPPTEAQAAAAIHASGVQLEGDTPGRLVQAHADASRLARLDAAHVRRLSERAGSAVPIVRIPELAGDVHDLRTLGKIADLLMTGGV